MIYHDIGVRCGQGWVAARGGLRLGVGRNAAHENEEEEEEEERNQRLSPPPYPSCAQGFHTPFGIPLNTMFWRVLKQGSCELEGLQRAQS